jgi:hypothetical protein
MRRDMKRVIIETLRYGGDPKRRHRLFTDLEDAPSKESVKRRYKDTKGFGDRTQPLVRYLHKQVGRRWNQVYSEICHVADRRNPSGAHLRSHIRDTVDRQNIDGIDGRQWYWRPLFVDTDGILKKRTPRPRWRSQPKTPEVLDRQGRLLKQEQGIWYFVRTEEYTVPVLQVYQTRLNAAKGLPPVYAYHTKTRYVKDKQLNRKELRTYEVRNA